jgi:catechol 2,3-dioxygenase-like lactoylglutathione lyase family enzyme
MISKIRHTGIVVRDLEKSLYFYLNIGFKLSTRQVEQGNFIDQVVGLDGVKVETAKLYSPCGSLLELLQYHSHSIKKKINNQKSNQLGTSHIALTVESIKSAIVEIVKLGGSKVNDPSLSECGNYLVAYCHDPEGVLLEFVEEVN